MGAGASKAAVRGQRKRPEAQLLGVEPSSPSKPSRKPRPHAAASSPSGDASRKLVLPEDFPGPLPPPLEGPLDRLPIAALRCFVEEGGMRHDDILEREGLVARARLIGPLDALRVRSLRRLLEVITGHAHADCLEKHELCERLRVAIADAAKGAGTHGRSRLGPFSTPTSAGGEAAAGDASSPFSSPQAVTTAGRWAGLPPAKAPSPSERPEEPVAQPTRRRMVPPSASSSPGMDEADAALEAAVAVREADRVMLEADEAAAKAEWKAARAAEDRARRRVAEEAAAANAALRAAERSLARLQRERHEAASSSADGGGATGGGNMSGCLATSSVTEVEQVAAEVAAVLHAEAAVLAATRQQHLLEARLAMEGERREMEAGQRRALEQELSEARAAAREAQARQREEVVETEIALLNAQTQVAQLTAELARARSLVQTAQEAAAGEERLSATAAANRNPVSRGGEASSIFSGSRPATGSDNLKLSPEEEELYRDIDALEQD